MTGKRTNIFHILGIAAFIIGILLMYLADQVSRGNEESESRFSSSSSTEQPTMEDDREDAKLDREFVKDLFFLAILPLASIPAIYLFADSAVVEYVTEEIGTLLFNSTDYGSLIAPAPYATSAFLTLIFSIGWGLREVINLQSEEKQELVQLGVGLSSGVLLVILVSVFIYRAHIIPEGIPVETVNAIGFTPAEIVRAVTVLVYGSLFTRAVEVTLGKYPLKSRE